MSASAPELPTMPVLANEDYHIPKDGVGLTGHPKRVLLGTYSKDKGTYSSRINQIIRQADKVPGPGMYISHKDWQKNGGYKFANMERTYKPMNKTPAPVIYEHPDIFMGKCNACSDKLSNRPRIIHGKVPTGKRRSFLDQAEKHGASTPGPGSCDPKQKAADRMDTHIVKIMDWSKSMQKTKGRGKNSDPNLGPDHYTPSFPGEDSQPTYTVPKTKKSSFLEAAVKAKWTDCHTKREIPGPGTYETQNYDTNKFTRGTKYLQLRGMSRSAVSGYF